MKIPFLHGYTTKRNCAMCFLVEAYTISASLYATGTRIWRVFSTAPEAFLRTLALEEENVREHVIGSVVYTLDAEPQEVFAFLKTVTLSDIDSAGTYALLRRKKYWL